MKKEAFGNLADGRPVDVYTISNAHGMQARVMTLGATLVSLKVPDAHGKLGDVVLGFKSPDDYLHQDAFIGASIGRYGNRIGHGTFTLDGKKYQLALNDHGRATLHGGTVGFNRRLWKVTAASAHSVTLAYHSPDGEENFPGNLDVTVRYTVEPNNELRLDYTAKTDKDTVINLTNHSYWNLNGEGNGDVLGQRIKIDADRYTPVDEDLIPTGELAPVAGTPFDFRKPTVIGAHINDDNVQLKRAGGYDHNFVLNHHTLATPVVTVYAPESGREMEVFTDQPGVQFYTGNFLDGTLKGIDGKPYVHRGALCLETQHFPDSPNKPNFPSTELKPGETFHSTTIYKFLTTHAGAHAHAHR